MRKEKNLPRGKLIRLAVAFFYLFEVFPVVLGQIDKKDPSADNTGEN